MKTVAFSMIKVRENFDFDKAGNLRRKNWPLILAQKKTLSESWHVVWVSPGVF